MIESLLSWLFAFGVGFGTFLAGHSWGYSKGKRRGKAEGELKAWQEAKELQDKYLAN